MRFYLVAILSIMCAACGPQSPTDGTEGHACRSAFIWTGLCNEGLSCVNDICQPCGGENQICCTGDDCHSDLACEGGLDGLGHCTAECGFVGMPCCSGLDECPGGGGQCVNGMCEADPVNPMNTCLNGSTKHVMYIITGDCSAVQLIFYTNTVEEAEACRQQYVNSALSTQEICPLDQDPELTNVCSWSNASGYSPYQMWNCSAAQLQTCEQYWCSNCTWTTGNCP